MLVSVKESSLNASKIYSTSVNSSLEPGLKLALCIRKEANSSMAKATVFSLTLNFKQFIHRKC